MITPLKRFRQLLEALAFCLGFIAIPFLPRKGALFLSRLFGRLAFILDGRSRRVALANLELALGTECDVAQREAIARDAFVAAARVMVDFFWFAVLAERRLTRWVAFDPSFEKCFATRPAVLVTAHLGNWEVMSSAMALKGYPYTGIAAPLDNPFINAVLNHVRQRAGQSIARRHGAVRDVIATLREGGRTIILNDQNTVPRDGGVFADFFGLPVPVSKIVHPLCARTRARAVFIYCVAAAHGGYTAFAREPFDPCADDGDELSTAQRINDECETVIRDHAGQWMWMYKRWRYIPPAQSPDGYPFYAQQTPLPFLKPTDRSRA